MELPTLTEEEQKIIDDMMDGKPLPEEEEKQEEAVEEEATEEKAEEPKEEEPAKPEPIKEDEKPSHDVMAKLRWEAAEAKRKAKALEDEMERLKNPPKPIPTKEENYEAHVDGRIETVEQRLQRLEREDEQRKAEQEEKRKITGALQELQTYEAPYAQKTPDYTDAANLVKGVIAASIKTLDPDIEPEELAKRTVKKYLEKAGRAVVMGIDPAEALYKEALALGYKKAEPPVSSEGKNFKKVQENSKKSGMAAAKGSGGTPETTEEMADKMSVAEFSRLSPDAIEKMLYGNI